MEQEQKPAKEKNPWTHTIQLPTTSLNMKAQLPKNEPAIQEFWKKNRIYASIQEKRKDGAERFLLHDGPPYANGNFHVGHGLNKILKDIIVKYYILNGYYSPYVPGWDCHGLPIELGVIKKLKDKKDTEKLNDPVAIRKECRRYATEYIHIQANDQSRFGVFWDDSELERLTPENQINPEKFYYTMSPSYEAAILGAFADIFKKGFIYKGEKPIHWCPHDQTALAEAEVEYAEHTSDSVYVAFPVANKPDTFVVIWTTTPWTLPANLGVSFHPDFSYATYTVENRNYIIATGLEESFFAKTKMSFSQKTSLTRAELEELDVRHPFLDRKSIVMFGTHVTLETGTGIVHTAPGHGQEDYVIGREYGLEPYSPVDHAGRYTKDFPLMEGKNVFAANPEVIDLLREKGLLLGHEKITHSYPHCWRCHNPLIFRATPQWFLKVEPLKEKAAEESAKIQWIPGWGEKRFTSMVENRPDWCLSRQRTWGVPIPAFACKKCGHTHMTPESLDYIHRLVQENGIEIWFSRDTKDLLPPGSVCEKCGHTEFQKENDILDVWFDSGVSWYSVLEKNPGLSTPADLYLEGSDQHRGWFQSSLWPSLAIRGQSPYKTVLTHGYILDDKGRAMSKSLGNVISPVKDIIPKYGADILRLWVSSEDYRSDSRIGFPMLDQLSEAYRKIRNTFRYILGNTMDGKAAAYLTDADVTEPIDRWVLHELYETGEKIKKAYQNYEFHAVYHTALKFTTVTLSNLYFDIIRDRLYCDVNPAESQGNSVNPFQSRRNSSIAALRIIGDSLMTLLAPVLSFTMEEIHQILYPGKSVFENLWPDLEKWKNPQIKEKMDKILEWKDKVNIKVEELRKNGTLGSSTEAKVTLPAEASAWANADEMAFYLVVSEVIFEEKASVHAEKSGKEKCPRCWQYDDLTEKGLCRRCSAIVENPA